MLSARAAIRDVTWALRLGTSPHRRTYKSSWKQVSKKCPEHSRELFVGTKPFLFILASHLLSKSGFCSGKL